MLKIMFLIVSLACLAPFLIKGPTGASLLSVADFSSATSLASIIERIKQTFGVADVIDIADDASDGGQGAGKSPSAYVTKVYKWRDQQGVWQFSDGLNVPEGAELVEISHQINLIPALEVARPSTSQLAAADAFATPANSATPAKKADAFDFSTLPAVLTSVSPEQFMQMGQTIETFQKVMDNQAKALEELVPKQP